ncbi:ABC transporter substrate-binding protein [Thalassospiraceae bacterium LMO-JJ14]|nr:ABC transporter substrate-binding protein [Thalassospiraceae bacterium LMO-JJ14]
MPEISLACWDYDRALPILDGRIGVAGYRLKTETAPPGKLFPLAVGDAPYDVTELSFASYVIQVSRGTCKYIGIPVFLSRAFRHGAIYVRSDRGIRTPEDLEGRVVGVPEYAMTLAVWVRGFLVDDFGVDVSALKYRTGGLNEPGRVERLKLDLPAEIDLRPLGPEKTLNEALLEGELDAIIAPAPPRAFADGNPLVQRLIDPAGPAERAYFERTGIFPIMHILGVRKDVAETYPDLPKALFDAFEDARKLAMARVKAVAEASANRDMSPWYAEAYEQAVATMGKDFWTYGVGGNEAALDAFCRYIHQQHLSARQTPIRELFHPETL